WRRPLRGSFPPSSGGLRRGGRRPRMTVEPMSAPIARATIAAGGEGGMRGPSGDNCQPWRFRWDGAVLDVIFVPERAASFYDVRNVASWISLGAVIVKISVAQSQ